MNTRPHYRFLVLLVTACVLGLAIPLHAEEKSTAQIEWEKLMGEKRINSPAWAFVEDDPTLPRVLIIGDSISIGYTPSVRQRLKGKANIHRIPENGGNTNRGLKSLERWLGDKPWDAIHFNWGLHDLIHGAKGQAVPPEIYEENLGALVGKLKQTGAKLVWATTTPVPEGAKARVADDAAKYNKIATTIMKEAGIRINDLHGYIRPTLATHQREANVHFTPDGSAHLGKQVTSVILETLATNPQAREGATR